MIYDFKWWSCATGEAAVSFIVAGLMWLKLSYFSSEAATCLCQPWLEFSTF
ncbi:unnamed protein product, partial [Brassica oleracea]